MSSAAACVAGTLIGVAPPAPAQPGAPCGPDYATAVNDAIRHEKYDRLTTAPWNPAPVGGSNYDPCADLSVVVVSIDNPRPTSPRQGFLFHRGTYIGTSLTKSRPYTTLDTAASTKDTAVLVYISGLTCPTCNDGTASTVRYRWNGSSAMMLDPIPPPQAWP